MSGGHFDYMYERIHDMYVGHMDDLHMDHFMEDLCKLLKCLEWYKSGDSSFETYEGELTKFKDKWFKVEKLNDIKVNEIKRILDL